MSRVDILLHGSPQYPTVENRPRILTGTTMGYYDVDGFPHTVDLQALPSPGSRFGVDATTGVANNGAFYDPRGWIDIDVANTRVDGYNFDGVAVGNIKASNAWVSRCWFHNIDGQDSWAIWCHNNGAFTNLTVEDNLCHGTTGVDEHVLTGLVKVDGPITGVTIRRNANFNCLTFVQFAPITGPGVWPYVNVVRDNYSYRIFDGGPTINGHSEHMNVSSGTGGLWVYRNHFTGPTGQTATIYYCHDSGDVGNIRTEDNLLDGLPQNTIYSGDTGAAEGVLIAAAGNMEYLNNKFANTGGQNPGGLLIDPGSGDSRVSASGNVFYPSLTPISGM